MAFVADLGILASLAISSLDLRGELGASLDGVEKGQYRLDSPTDSQSLKIDVSVGSEKYWE